MPQFDQILHGYDLVQIQGDQPVISEARAKHVADVWAQKYAETTNFSAIFRAHVQPLTDTGVPSGEPGPLQWEFVIEGNTNFAASVGAGNYLGELSASATPYPFPEHYVIIAIDATTGKEDGMTLT